MPRSPWPPMRWWRPLNSDADESVREMAAWALAGANRSPAVVQALSKAAQQDANPKLQSTAVWALGSMGSESSVDVLVGGAGQRRRQGPRDGGVGHRQRRSARRRPRPW